MKRPFLVQYIVFAFAFGTGLRAQSSDRVELKLRQRVEAARGTGQWNETAQEQTFKPGETAVIICDLWDRHWCQGATQRVGLIAGEMAPLVEKARRQGMLIIHAPSGCMEFYQDTTQRKMMQAALDADPPVPISRWRHLDPQKESTLPIDDSDGGCDDEPQCRNHRAWTRQHSAIRVAEGDGISDSGAEMYGVFRRRSIRNILYMGVHANMCVLGRSFGIRQMSELGFNCVLLRDLTDAMYNSRKSPHVSHAAGTELVIQHIEKYWCPSALSGDVRWPGKE